MLFDEGVDEGGGEGGLARRTPQTRRPTRRADAKGHTTWAARDAAIRERREGLVMQWLEEDPQVSTPELVRRLRNAVHNRSISESTVSEIRLVIEARHEALTVPDSTP